MNTQNQLFDIVDKNLGNTYELKLYKLVHYNIFYVIID